MSQTSPTSLITRWLCTCLARTQHQRCFRSLLCIGTVQGNTDICLFLVQIQLRYLYLLLSHHHSPTISCDLAILNTFLTAQTLEQRHLSTNLNSSYTPTEICSEWLLDLMNNYGWHKLQSLWFQGPLILAHAAVEYGSLPSDQNMTSFERKILFVSILGDEL